MQQQPVSVDRDISAALIDTRLPELQDPIYRALWAATRVHLPAPLSAPLSVPAGVSGHGALIPMPHCAGLGESKPLERPLEKPGSSRYLAGVAPRWRQGIQDHVNVLLVSC